MIEPLLIVCGVGFLVLIADLVLPHSKRHWCAYLAMGGVAWAFAIALGQWGQEQRGYSGMVVMDSLSTLFNLLFLGSTFVVMLLSEPFLRQERVEQGEYYALILFCTSGMMLLASSLDLITLFLGIEVLSISLYILPGAFASAILLYGVALTYGATGTTNLTKIADALTNAEGSLPAGLLLAGMAMILIGFAFKVALVPFHMWTPDVYEGAPTPITAFMSAGPKAAAFAAFLRTFFVAFGPIHGDWNMLLSGIAALTMTVGNVAAIAQTNVKRMLAYSSIAHSGYVLIGIVAGGNAGGTGAIFYLIAYTVMNLGAFAVVILLEHRKGGGDELKDYAGVGFRYPLIGAALSLFMISLSGIPPTVGFVGKLYLFGAAVQTGHIPLAIIGVLNSATSIFYYLRLLVLMYMREPGEVLPPVRVPVAIGIALVVTAVATLGFGVFPGQWIEYARAGVRALFS